jgi:hypothetical protein
MKNLLVIASSLLSLFSAASAQDGDVVLDGAPRLVFRKVGDMRMTRRSVAETIYCIFVK